MKSYTQATVLALLGSLTISCGQDPSATQLNGLTKLQPDMAGYWTNLTRLDDGTISASTLFFRGDGLYAGVITGTKGTNAKSATISGMWTFTSNALVLTNLVLTNKQVISKASPVRTNQAFRVVGISSNRFGIEADDDSVSNRLAVSSWYRSQSATQLISKYFTVHEPGIIRKKYSVDRPADTGQMEKRR